ncbi:MAG: tetratricopeptide repeat protein, partial [Eubacteriales bacterium]|nr:tetratricopeptide repeat protein [Eubacteriales bacterium]
AILYSNSGKIKEAEKLYLEALEIFRRLSATDGKKNYELDLARVCNTLANLYTYMGRLKEAEELNC